MSDDINESRETNFSSQCCQTCKWDSGSTGCAWPVPIWLDRFLEFACEDIPLTQSYRTKTYRTFGIEFFDAADGVPRGVGCPTWGPKGADHEP